MNKIWDEVKKLYPEGMATILADDIPLLLICSGFDNQTIAWNQGLEKKEVDEICYRYFKFDGWEKKLGFSPWYFYKLSLGNKSEFINSLLTKTQDYDIISKSFEICDFFCNIRKGMEEIDG